MAGFAVVKVSLALLLLASSDCVSADEGSNEDGLHVTDEGEDGAPAYNFDYGEVVFVILSSRQRYNTFNIFKSEDIGDRLLVLEQRKKTAWHREIAQHTKLAPQVLVTSEEWAPRGSWTVLPALPKLKAMFMGFSSKVDVKWFFFATEHTQIDFKKLKLVLERYDPKKEYLLGHGLSDDHPTITHHYARSEGEESLVYPSFPSGWALSPPLLKRLSNYALTMDFNFNIDPQYEIAQVAKYLDSVKLIETAIRAVPPHPEGVLLTHVPEFCVSPELEGDCATAYLQNITECAAPVSLSDVLFAVKTHSGFHRDRLPVIRHTWGPDAGDSLVLFSDIEDPAYGTVFQGVPNTAKGHCGKTMAIIGKMHTEERWKGVSWLVIADDDTLLSVPRVLKYLSCFNPEEPVMIGEAYGFYAHKPDGYSYVTGGGGMILSRGAVSRMVQQGVKCPSPDHPDDMFLGSTARYYKINVVFSPLYHQDQPRSYPAKSLQLQEPISFHRHSPDDPYTIYDTYLKESPPLPPPEEGEGEEPKQAQPRRSCRHGHSTRRSRLLSLLEDEELRDHFPEDMEDKVRHYVEMADQLGSSEWWGEEGSEEGECFMEDEDVMGLHASDEL